MKTYTINKAHNTITRIEQQSGRDNRMDSIKGLLILLVILGHVIGVLGSGELDEMVWQFIYTFHMPLFVFVSGYFTRRKEDKKTFWKGLRQLIVVLVIFQTISLLLLWCSTGKLFSLRFLVTPYWTLWYLLSLVFWKIILQFSPNALLNKPYVFMAITIIVSVLCGLMPSYGRIFSIQRTMNFFPFFLFGYYFNQGGGKKKLWPNWCSWSIICVILALNIAGLSPSYDKTQLLLRGADHYNYTDIPVKIYFLLNSFALMISIYNVMPENKLLSYLGRDTMFYYLYHGLVIKFLLQPVVARFRLPTAFPYLVCYWLVIIGVIYVFGRVKPLRRLTNPIRKEIK